MEALSTKLHGGIKNKVVRRVGYPFICFAVSAAFIIALAKFGPFDEMRQLPSLDALGLGNSNGADLVPSPPDGVNAPLHNLCVPVTNENDTHTLDELKAKYRNLMDDKFTYVST